jgi:hypothetical protein
MRAVGDLAHAHDAKRALTVQQRRSGALAGSKKYPEHVDVAAVIDGGELDAGNDANPFAAAGRRHLRQRRDRVVIGHADRGEPGSGRARDEIDGRQPPVRRRRVHVQIDQRSAGRGAGSRFRALGERWLHPSLICGAR